LIAAIILLVALLNWPARDRDQECFQRLRVGMPEEQTRALLTQCGYSQVWAGVDHDRGEEVVRFTRDEGGNPSIVVVYSVTDRRVTEAVFDFRPEPGFLDRLFGH
jgi:hypothetical protein